LTPLAYDEPVHVVRGEGVWLVDAAGRRLLDAYNNVPVVGHCHPRVTEAVVRQTRMLNTHARYLYEPLVELAERLLATMPPGAALDTVMLVNSGSEANDVAWRIATGTTGRGGALVTPYAYHGVTAAIADLSPEEWPAGYEASHVARIPAGWSDADVAAAVAARPLAATFLDAGLTSDGIVPPAPERAQALARATLEAGPFRRRRGAGRFRAERRAPLGVRAPRHRAGCRHAWKADGQRLSRCRRRDPPRAGRAVRVRADCVQHLRRQPCRSAGGAGGPRRDRGPSGSSRTRSEAASCCAPASSASGTRRSATCAASGCSSASSSTSRHGQTRL
jgi:Aminotransferase class-III